MRSLHVLLAVAGCTGSTVEHDIVYDARFDETKLDLYLPDNHELARPAVMLVHGGSWTGGDKDHFFRMGPRLADSGFVAASSDSSKGNDKTNCRIRTAGSSRLFD